MNDTQHLPPQDGPSPAGPDDEFDAKRLRSIADMQRSSDDRIVAGVCAGAAKYLNIDPIIVRVVLAVLTVAGFAGIIIYVAAWILLPSDDEDKSLAAEWFNLDKNEEQVRVGGLVGAVILAALSIVGNSSWAWWGGTPWWLLPIALLVYVFWIRPRRRREVREAVANQQQSPGTGIAAKTSTRREPRSAALLVLTTSLAAIALAATWIVDETLEDLHWTTYVAVALAIVGVGLLIGTFFGHGGPLIGIGILLAITLAIGSVFPSGRIGSQEPTPTTAAQVEPYYRHGIGLFELDLTGVSDPQSLLGRTITIETGIGQTRVILPDGLNVGVRADIRAGQISILGRNDDGTDVEMSDAPDQPHLPALTIDIVQKLGNIEVLHP